MGLKKERDFMIRGQEKFKRKWIKMALTDPFVYLLGITFFTSSVAINGLGVLLPTIIYGLGSVLVFRCQTSSANGFTALLHLR